MFHSLFARIGFWRPSAGDVVVDRYDGQRKTVESTKGDRINVMWFEGLDLRRGSLLRRNVSLAD